VVVNGIEELATRGDLLDRSVIVTLQPIPDHRRLPESDFWGAFSENKAQLFGALLTVLSTALAKLPAVTITNLPRMADFALWATAAEEAAGMISGSFMAAYAGNRAAGNELALEASPVAKVLMDFMATSEFWTGTATELLIQLDIMADDKIRRLRVWPQTGRGLSGILKRLAPNLRAVGLEVDFGTSGRGRGRRRNITLRRVRENIVPIVPTVPTSGKQGSDGGAGGANEDDGGATGAQDGVAVSPYVARAGAYGDGGGANFPPYSDLASSDDWTPEEEVNGAFDEAAEGAIEELV
jgi:hypothetical protein